MSFKSSRISVSFSPALALIGIPIVSTMAIGLLYIRFQMGVPGLTTPFALILTYLNGVLVGYDLVQDLL